MAVPEGLSAAGGALWESLSPGLDEAGRCVLLEACRAKDRLDEFDSIIHGRGVLELMRFRLHDSWDEDGDHKVLVEVKFDAVIAAANSTAAGFARLLKDLPESAAPAKPRSALDELAARRRGERQSAPGA